MFHLRELCTDALGKSLTVWRVWEVTLNAFTNKEDTVYYSAILKKHTAKAIDILTDIVFHSTYPQQEIDKEVEVICDEIDSYKDSPADLIYDEFENIHLQRSSAWTQHIGNI
jgi:predicted Zn-dependent peptidase